MTNILKLKIPTIRHSDFKIISQNLSIKKTNYYYLNTAPNKKKIQEEFKKIQYSKANQDKTFFKHKNKNLYKKRSKILKDEIKKRFKKKIKILDYGCNKGELLQELKKCGYINLFGYDINQNFKKNLLKKKINFLNIDEVSSHKFDLIIFSHSLSYVKDLINILKKIKKILNKNSHIIINCSDVSKRQFSLCFGDQTFYFERDMIKNLFQKIGSVRFIKSNYLQNDIISIISNKRKKKFFLKKISNKNFKILNAKIEKLNKIKNSEKKIDIFHHNFQSKIISYFLNQSKSRTVSRKKKFFKDKIIGDYKNLLHSKNPVVISKNNENKKIISNLKQRNKKIYLI